MAFLLLLLAGCATTTGVHTDYDHSIDFGRYRAYDWMRPPAGEDTRPSGGLPVDEPLQKAVNNELLGRGLRRSSQPDFLISYRFTAAGGASGTRANGPDAEETAPAVGHGGKGNLVLDFVDAKSRKSIWRGTATTDWGSEVQEERIRDTVTQLLARFPPGHGR
jgi:uncharacterized protein DUF4136